MPSQPSITPEHLYLLLWKAFYAVEAHDRRSIRRLGFKNDTDFAVLEVLYSKGPMAVNEMGRRVLLTSGSITTAVDRVEKRGWVERTPHPQDRRVVVVALTAAGREVIAPVLKQHFRNLGRALEGLSREEQQTLGTLLRKMGKHAASIAPEDERA